MPLFEASVKRRTGGPSDDADDIAAGVWAGVLPLRLIAGDLVTSHDAQAIAVPDEVARLAQSLR
jgi:uncharacterized protein